MINGLMNIFQDLINLFKIYLKFDNEAEDNIRNF